MASPTKRDRGTEPTPNRDGAQYIEEKGEERLVKNSPYGTTRQSYGWGSPFQKPRKAVSTRYPNVRIGASSLNGTPGKDRSMDKLLQQYQKKFTVLEHCNPYHRMGEVEQWEKWAGMVAADFVYTVKCNQYLTHMRMLEMDADLQAHIEHFFVDRIPKMKNKFGAALVQLPPQFRATPENRDRLRAFAAQVPTSVRVAVEFRHASWFTDETYDILRAAKWALVATHNFDVGDSPIVDTGAGFMYCRLHGSVAQYCGDYGLEGMRRWAAVIRNFVANNGPDAPVYIFLNNNESHAGHLTSSVVDATALATILDTEDTAPAPSAVTAAGAGVAAASTSGVASAAAAAESATPPTAAAGASPARAATQPTQQSKGTAADPEEISTQSEDGSAIEVA